MPQSQLGELPKARRELFRALQSISSAAGSPLLRELGGWESDVQSLPALLAAFRKAIRPYVLTIAKLAANVPFSCLEEEGPKNGNCAHGILDAYGETVVRLLKPVADDGNGGLKVTNANRHEIRTIWLPLLRRDQEDWSRLKEKLETEALALLMNSMEPKDPSPNRSRPNTKWSGLHEILARFDYKPTPTDLEPIMKEYNARFANKPRPGNKGTYPRLESTQQIKDCLRRREYRKGKQIHS